MPSALFYKANEITQLVNDIEHTFLPIRWSAKHLKWLYGSRWSWRGFVLISMIWKFFILTPIIIFALTQLVVGRVNVEGKKLIQMSTCSVLLVLLWGSLYLDILFWLYGKEIVACCNWCYRTEDIMLAQKMDSITISKDKGNTDSKIEQILKLFKTDPVGVVLILFAASFPSLLLQIVLITIQLNVDPFMIYVVLATENFKQQIWVAKTARIMLLVFMSQWLLITFRIFVPIYFGMTAIFLRFMNVLKSSNATYKSVQLYKHLIVERNVLRDFERNLTSVGLVGMFLVLVLTSTQVIHSLSEKKFAMFVVTVLVFGICISVISVTFHICCAINVESIEILQRWESKCGYGRNDQCIRRLLRSNRPLSVPVGEVGIIDREIKLNFYSAVTDYAVNILLAIQ